VRRCLCTNLPPDKPDQLWQLSTLQSAEIVLPTTEGREIRLRRVARPSAEQRALLDQLDMTLPERLHVDQECSADFAVA
jgi:antitoxin component of MazEF toxin-antitoxin module